MKVELFVFVCLCICVAWGASNRDHWVDPTDLLNYDHHTKKMRNKVKEVPAEFDSYQPRHHAEDLALSRCEASLKEFTDAAEKKEFSNKFLMGMLQRQTAMVLQAAQITGGWEQGGESTLYMQSFLLLSLSREQLQTLQQFVKSGKLEPEALDSTWQAMWTPVEDPSRSKWDWMLKWLPPNPFTVSRETFIVWLEFGVVLVPVLMLLLGMSLRRVVWIFLFLLVLVSGVLRYHRVTQANEMRQRHMLVDPRLMPPECRPHSLSWSEWFSLMFSSQGEIERKCGQYYEKRHTDPVTHTTPLEQITHLFMDVVESVSARMGTSMKDFCEAAFADLPWPVNAVVCTVAKLSSLLVVLGISVVMWWYCFTGYSFRLGRGDPHRVHNECLREAVTPPTPSLSPQYHIVNHGHLVLTGGTSGIESVESFTTVQDGQSTSSKFRRAQSDGAIKFSSQSTSTTELENIGNQSDNNSQENYMENVEPFRPRSLSEGTVITCKNTNASALKQQCDCNACIRTENVAHSSSSNLASKFKQQFYSSQKSATFASIVFDKISSIFSSVNQSNVDCTSSTTKNLNHLTIPEEDENMEEDEDSYDLMNTDIVETSTKMDSNCDDLMNTDIVETSTKMDSNCDDLMNTDIVETSSKMDVITEEDNNENNQQLKTEISSPTRSEASTLSPSRSELSVFLESLQLDESVVSDDSCVPESASEPVISQSNEFLQSIQAELSVCELVENMD